MCRFITFIAIVLIFLSSCTNDEKVASDIDKLTWAEIEEAAKGKSVTMVMYVGSKGINRYMNEYVIPTLKERYNLTVNIVNGQGKDIISNIMSEKEAGKEVSEADLCWINGETFYQLRQIDGLFGPFTAKLPNWKYVDHENPIIKYDFQEEVRGFETPWNLASFTVIYDSARVKQPPVSMQDFENYWKLNPGKFTIPNDFSGYTLLKSWLIELAGGGNALDGKFDVDKYKNYSTQLWEWINKNKQFFWKRGETFPANNTSVSQMFANGELNFAFSFNIADIDLRVEEGLFPASSKSYILKAGSIQNTNYIGITSNSGNKEAAMMVCNFLISPEAQAKKADLTFSGSQPVLAYHKLPKEEQQKFDALQKIKYGLQPEEFAGKGIKEPEPTYMIRMTDDFRKFVIEAQ